VRPLDAVVKPGDGEIVLEEPVARAGGVQLLVGQDLEGEVEASAQFILPLLGEATRADDKVALQIAARDQLLESAGPALRALPHERLQRPRRRASKRSTRTV
jgi:hypothetical protein